MTFRSTKVVTECNHGWYELQWKILQRDLSKYDCNLLIK